jgi:hypothetical protein
MQNTTDTILMEAVRESAHQLTGAARAYEPLMDLIGDASFVLLGEVSNATHEFHSDLSAPGSRNSSSRTKASRPSRPRPIGPTPTALTAMYTARAMTPMRTKRSPISDGSHR